MTQLVKLSNGTELLPKRIRGAKTRYSGTRVYAAIWLSVVALVAAAPPGARGNALDAPDEPESTRGHIQSPLSVAEVVEVESPGQADCGISIDQRESLPSGAYVRIRGLPTAVVLSAGRPWWEKIPGQADEQRAWVVPVKATEDLKVRMPRGVSGNSELLVTLVDGDGRMLAEQSSELRIKPQVALAPTEKIVSMPIEPVVPPPEKVVVAPAPEKVVVAPAPEKTVVAPPPEKVVVAPPPEKTVVASTSEIVVVAPAPDKAASQPQRNPDEITTSALSRSDPPLRSFDRPAPSSDNLAQADRLVAKGEDYLARGDIAVARRYFERAAELGLPIAALRMAETQDPRELARRGVHGVKANLDEARRWYQRALELNVPEADSKLRRLGRQ
jgi:Sel1 repeat